MSSCDCVEAYPQDIPISVQVAPSCKRAMTLPGQWQPYTAQEAITPEPFQDLLMALLEIAVLLIGVLYTSCCTCAMLKRHNAAMDAWEDDPLPAWPPSAPLMVYLRLSWQPLSCPCQISHQTIAD